MLLTLQMIIHLFCILEDLLAWLATVFFDCDFLKISIFKSLLFLLGIPQSYLFTVLSQFFLFFSPLFSLFFLFSLPLGLFLSLFSHFELLVSRVSLLDIVE